MLVWKCGRYATTAHVLCSLLAEISNHQNISVIFHEHFNSYESINYLAFWVEEEKTYQDHETGAIIGQEQKLS